MSQLIDNIEKDLLEVETRLVEEFHRTLTLETDAQLSEVSPSSKAEFQLTINKLRHVLDHSGSDTELELTRERHDTLRTRMITVLQLIDRRVPAGLLAEAEEDTRRDSFTVRPAHAQSHKRTRNDTIQEEASLMGRIRAFFAGWRARPAASEIYREGEIYSVTQELANLASLIMQSIIAADESEAKEQPAQSSPTTQASKQGT